ncbi:MAG TPA: cytochrome C oxidase subunit IV family protein [Terriglobales bacterium]|jgi:cytochrome c oxidase subunit 4|nr:cytochrome C oxidase subunit IV family protein [Terriglobales bacterium]
MPEHIVPKKIYLATWATLIVMTLVTTLVAFVDLGRFNTVLALAIATFKATLVVLFFMHAKYTPRLTRVVITAGIFWLGILLAFSMVDYLSRLWPA